MMKTCHDNEKHRYEIFSEKFLKKKYSFNYFTTKLIDY